MQTKSTKKEVVCMLVLATLIVILLALSGFSLSGKSKVTVAQAEQTEFEMSAVQTTNAMTNVTRSVLRTSPSWTASTLVTGDYAVPNYTSLTSATNYVLSAVLSGYQWEGSMGNVQIPVFCNGVNIGSVSYEVQKFCSAEPVIVAKAYYYEVDFSRYIADGFTNFHMIDSTGNVIDIVNPESVMNSVAVATYNNYVVWGSTYTNYSNCHIICDWAQVPSKFSAKNSVDLSDGTVETGWSNSVRIKNNINDTVYTLQQGGGKAIRRNGSIIFMFPMRSPFYFAGGTFSDIVVTAEQQTPGFATWETTTIDSAMIFRSDNYLFVFQNSTLYERGYDVTYIWGDLPETNPEVPLPDNPVKEGYTFVGWYYDSVFTQPYDGAPIYADTTLYAKFEINTYIVTFDVAGGVAIDNAIVNWNTAVTPPQATRVGYDFLGWFLSDGTEYIDQPITSDTTLTAHWRVKTYTVTFYVGEEKYKEITVVYGTVLSTAMAQAKIESFMVMNVDGKRLSKQNSVITEDTQVLVEELTGWEKYGDFVARNPWYTWVMVGLGSALLIFAVVGIILLVKRG